MNTVFQGVTLGVLAVMAVLMLVHLLLVHLPRRRRMAPAMNQPIRYNWWERLLHLALTFSFLALAVSSLVPVCRGQAMTGWLLMGHVAIGGVFAGSLAAMAVTWGHSHRFVAGDAGWMSARGGWFGKTLAPAGRFDPLQKTLYWLILALGLALILSAALSMVPLLDQDGLAILMDIHRYAGLAMVAAVAAHAYHTLLAKGNAWRRLLTGKRSTDVQPPSSKGNLHSRTATGTAARTAASRQGGTASPRLE